MQIDFDPGKPNESKPNVLPYISITATKRVRDSLPVPTVCPYCNGGVLLLRNSEVYGRSIGDWPFVYACAGSCEAYVGVHADTNIPLGTLANKELRTVRQRAKQSFQSAMTHMKISRNNAYKWLAGQLSLPVNETHYGWMDIKTAERAYLITEAVQNKQPE